MVGATGVLASIRDHFASLGLLAGAGVAAFMFQVVQTAIDQGASPDKGLYRWAVPTLVSLVVLLATALAVLSAERWRRAEHAEGKEFASAIVRFGRRLSEEKRYRSLLRLRADESLTLHILGCHDQRVQLGSLALRAAAVLSKDLDRAAILIDDLGWANFLMGAPAEALTSISRGIELAKAQRLANPTGSTHETACILEAKGVRHTAVIRAQRHDGNINEWLADLDRAASLLETLDLATHTVVRRERAQVDHSKAFAISLYLQINRKGSIGLLDNEGRQLVATALKYLSQSIAAFKELDDEARLAKALLLEHRLLEAIGDKIGAVEAKARAEQAISQSDWLETGGVESILGPITPLAES